MKVLGVFGLFGTWKYKLQNLISRSTKRIFIIPTKYGIYFLLTLFTLFLISLSFGHSLAFTTTFIFFSLIMVSAHFTNYNIDKVQIVSLKPNYVVAADTSSFDVLVYNPSNKWRFDMQLSFVHSGQSEVFCLAPYEKKVVSLNATLSTRGQYLVNKLRLFTSFPFGLFYAWSFREVDARFTCLTKQTNEELALPSLVSMGTEGGLESFLGGKGSDEFSGHIKYLPGMPLRGIDWKAFARGKGYLYKEFLEYGNFQVSLNLSALEGNLEQKLERLSRLVVLAEEQGLSYSINLEGQAKEYGSGAQFKKKNLEAIALYRCETQEML